MKLREKPDGTFLIRERDPNPQEPDHKHTLMVVYVYLSTVQVTVT